MLIKQIKVGGTTYNIGINAKAPLVVSGDTLNLLLGTGLHAKDGALEVKVATGLRTTAEGIMLLVSGHDKGYNRGLTLDKGVLELKIGSGLRFNEDGSLDLA